MIESNDVSADTRGAKDATRVTGLDLIGYCTADPARAIAFYRDTLGLEPTTIDEHGRGAEFTLADGSTFGVWNPGEQSGMSGAIVMFAVPDARATVAKLRASGLEIADAFDTGVCIMAPAKDPDGNGFIVHQRTVTD